MANTWNYTTKNALLDPTVLSVTSNYTDNGTCANNTNCEAQHDDESYYLKYIIPVVFSLIFIIGIVGNSLVLIVVIWNKHMRNTTNLLMANLAAADLCFIVFCVPFTATMYSSDSWMFGEFWCHFVMFMVHARTLR